jgi:hypothetical protein
MRGMGAAKGFGRRVATAGTDAAPAVIATPAASVTSYLRDPVVQAVMREFEVCAMQVVLILSLFNRPNPEAIGPFPFKELRHVALTRFPAVRDVLAERGMPMADVALLSEFFEAFRSAQPAMGQVMDDMPGNFDNGWLFEANLTLKATAQLALRVLNMLPGLHTLCQSGPDGLAPAAELETAVRAVTVGGAPYWEAKGLALPQWQVKRSKCRHTVNMRAKLTTAHGTFDIVVANVSRTGLGASTCPAMTTGQNVSILLESGRSFMAKLVWVKGDQAGFEFATPLGFTDPLIMA